MDSFLQVATAGAIEPALRLLSSPQVQLAASAAALLQRLSELPAAQPAIAVVDGEGLAENPARLAALLSNVPLLLPLLTVLRNLSAGGHMPGAAAATLLLRLLEPSSPPEALSLALETLRILVALDADGPSSGETSLAACSAIVASAEGLARICPMLAHRDASVASRAVSLALALAAGPQAGLEELSRAGAPALAVPLLGTASGEALLKAAALVQRLTAVPAARSDLCAAGAPAALARHLAAGAPPALRASAAASVAALMQEPRVAEVLVALPEAMLAIFALLDGAEEPGVQVMSASVPWIGGHMSSRDATAAIARACHPCFGPTQ